MNAERCRGNPMWLPGAGMWACPYIIGYSLFDIRDSHHSFFLGFEMESRIDVSAMIFFIL